jgi:ParB family chromosome partitioning protein
MSNQEYLTQDCDFWKFTSCSLARKCGTLPITSIVVPDNQSRRYFDPDKLKELSDSIRQHGIIEPLIVCQISGSKELYKLVAGERRYRAAKEIGLADVPVVIHNFTDEEAITVSLIENLLREDLNPLEETEGILNLLSVRLNKPVKQVICLLYQMNNEQKKVINDNVMVSYDKQMIKDIFESLGLMKWDSFVSNRLPILKMPQDILEVLRQGKIAYTKAKVLASVKNDQLRQALTEEAIFHNLSLSQIKKKIKINYFPEEQCLTLEQRAKTALQRLTKYELWKDPEKQQELEQILTQLELLMSG